MHLKNGLLGYLLNELTNRTSNSDSLLSTLARIEDLPCSFAWNDECRLAVTLSGIAMANTNQVALNRLIRLFAFSEGVLPFSVHSKDIHRTGFSDRSDIACMIASMALRHLPPADEIAESAMVKTGLDYIKWVYSRTSLYYPAEYLYADTLRRQGSYKKAADIAVELHRRASATLNNANVETWTRDFQLPRIVAKKALRMLLFTQRAAPDTMTSIRTLKLLVQLGVSSQTERDKLEAMQVAPSRCLSPVDRQNTAQTALELPVEPLPSWTNANRPKQASAGRGPHHLDVVTERLNNLMVKIGEPAHYSALREIYADAFGEISAAQLVSALKSKPSAFRQVADGTFAISTSGNTARHYILDIISEVSGLREDETN